MRCVLARVAFGLLCALFLHAPAQSATIYDSQGFEAPPFVAGQVLEGQDAADGPWVKTASSSTATVINNPGGAAAGQQYVEVSRAANSDGRWAVAKPQSNVAGSLVIEWDMFVPQATGPQPFGPYYAVEAYDTVGGGTLLIGSAGMDAKTGEFLFQESGTGILSVTGLVLPFDTWHHFEMVLNYDTQQYSVTVNGTPAVTQGFVDPGITDFSDASIAAVAAGGDPDSQAATGTARFDNYVIRTQTSSFVVTSLADADDGVCNANCTLREAINAANNSADESVITFAPAVTGTIQLGSVLPTLNSSLDLQGPGAGVLTVRGEGTADPYRIFLVGNGQTVTISGLTIANGGGINVGGGIANTGTLTVRNCVITGNAADDGGGLYNSGTVTLENCTISQNNSAFGGGGFYNDGFVGNAQAMLTDCILTGNDTGGSGGAIFSTGDGNGAGTPGAATLTVTGCTFFQNTSANNGGAIVSIGNNGSALLTMSRCTLDNNVTTGGNGGGVYNEASTANIAASTFSANHADAGAGAALVNTFSATLTLTNSTLSGNSAPVGLGGGLSTSGPTTLRNCTITNNVAANGGGINSGGTPNLFDTIVAGNTAIDTSNPNFAPDIANAVASASSFNLIGINSGMTGISNGTGGNQIGTVANPLNPQLGPLANNGGPTPTHALLSRSPAINKGNSSLSTDQRGVVRPQGAESDIGAYEAIQIEIADQTITEGDGGTANMTFAVTLSAASPGPVSFAYVVANGSAKSPGDFTTTLSDSDGATPGTLTIPAGQTSGSITVPITGDTINEASEVFYVLLSNADNGIFGKGRGVGTILDNDNTPVALSINDLSINEGNTGTRNANFTVNLSGVSGQVVRVNVSTSNGAATAGADYTGLPTTTISFSPGQTQRTVTVAVLGDTRDEANESFFVNLTNAVNATIADNQGRGTITDDDRAPALTLADVSISEGDSGTKTLTFTVNLSAASGRTVTANYATADGTAKAGSDYVAQTGSLSFAPGQTSKTISITINGDTLVEPNEVFYVILSGATNASIGRGRAIGTIINDDASG